MSAGLTKEQNGKSVAISFTDTVMSTCSIQSHLAMFTSSRNQSWNGSLLIFELSTGPTTIRLSLVMGQKMGKKKTLMMTLVISKLSWSKSRFSTTWTKSVNWVHQSQKHMNKAKESVWLAQLADTSSRLETSISTQIWHSRSCVTAQLPLLHQQLS